MLHELCFNYMWFDELHTKLHFNYEFKGLKLIEHAKRISTWQNLTCYDQWFIFGGFLHNSDRKSFVNCTKGLFRKIHKICHILRN